MYVVTVLFHTDFRYHALISHNIKYNTRKDNIYVNDIMFEDSGYVRLRLK